MDRGNHYEVAFEAYLQSHGICYVAVDETRRALLNSVPLKSLDFLVFGPTGARLVVDVKGRRFPAGTVEKPRLVWESWSSRGDIEGLDRWARLAGEDYRGVLVFAYLLGPNVQMSPDTPDLFTFRNQTYLFRAVDVMEYRDHMRTRSPRWDTVSLSSLDFRSVVRPFQDLVCAAPSREFV